MLSMLDIKQKHAATGGHWFDASTLRFFRSRVGGNVHEGPGGVFFVSSEQFTPSVGPPDPRLFTIRQFDPDTGNISTAGKFQAYRSRCGAENAARRAARSGVETKAPAEGKVTS